MPDHLPYAKHSTRVFENNVWHDSNSAIAHETAIAFSYDGTTHAVMMATPANLEDFAIGFSLTEGLIGSADEVENINIIPFDNGIDIQIQLSSGQREAFIKRRRNMAGPVGCGLCGIESLEAATRHLPHITSMQQWTATEIIDAIAALNQNQQLNTETRTLHAAAYYHQEKGLLFIREDIGRHNALDKLIGALTKEKIPADEGLITLTSRLSVEMVQKAALYGAPIIVAVSSPTYEAVCTGENAGMTLIARARQHSFEIFCGEKRINASSQK